MNSYNEAYTNFSYNWQENGKKLYLTTELRLFISLYFMYTEHMIFDTKYGMSLASYI
jgi:hypothetical protein